MHAQTKCIEHELLVLTSDLSKNLRKNMLPPLCRSLIRFKFVETSVSLRFILAYFKSGCAFFVAFVDFKIMLRGLEYLCTEVIFQPEYARLDVNSGDKSNVGNADNNLSFF